MIMRSDVMSEPDRSETADAKRFRWLLDGNGYFMEAMLLCGIGPCSDDEKDAARKCIDDEMAIHR